MSDQLFWSSTFGNDAEFIKKGKHWFLIVDEVVLRSRREDIVSKDAYIIIKNFNLLVGVQEKSQWVSTMPCIVREWLRGDFRGQCEV